MILQWFHYESCWVNLRLLIWVLARIGSEKPSQTRNCPINVSPRTTYVNPAMNGDQRCKIRKTKREIRNINRAMKKYKTENAKKRPPSLSYNERILSNVHKIHRSNLFKVSPAHSSHIHIHIINYCKLISTGYIKKWLKELIKPDIFTWQFCKTWYIFGQNRVSKDFGLGHQFY